MAPSIGATRARRTPCSVIRRSFRRVRSVVSMVSSKSAKERSALLKERHASVFSAPEFHFAELKDDPTVEVTEKTMTSITFQNPNVSKTVQTELQDEHLLHTSVTLKDLPIAVLERIFGHLVVSNQPLILKIDSQTPSGYRTRLHLDVLATCRLFFQIGMPLLYGSNTITTSSPATSKNFDKHLLSLPGRHRQLIKHVKLQIDWAGELWAKLPLIARVIGEIVGLKSLEIEILGPVQRAGAEMMLTVERRFFLTLVTEDLKALKVFKLQGFGDDKLAKKLEKWVAGGHKSGAKL